MVEEEVHWAFGPHGQGGIVCLYSDFLLSPAFFMIGEITPAFQLHYFCFDEFRSETAR